jgi:hypothetical protein
MLKKQGVRAAYAELPLAPTKPYQGLKLLTKDVEQNRFARSIPNPYQG